MYSFPLHPNELTGFNQDSMPLASMQTHRTSALPPTCQFGFQHSMIKITIFFLYYKFIIGGVNKKLGRKFLKFLQQKQINFDFHQVLEQEHPSKATFGV